MSSYIVTADGLGVDEASRGPLDNLETEVGAGHKFENHVEHALEKTFKISFSKRYIYKYIPMCLLFLECKGKSFSEAFILASVNP